MELFKDKDCKFDNGYIQVRCDMPFYEPGNMVEGTVYMRVTKEITGCKGLDLEVKGGAKNSFIRFW